MCVCVCVGGWVCSLESNLTPSLPANPNRAILAIFFLESGAVGVWLVGWVGCVCAHGEEGRKKLEIVEKYGKASTMP